MAVSNSGPFPQVAFPAVAFPAVAFPGAGKGAPANPPAHTTGGSLKWPCTRSFRPRPRPRPR
jgi:hypothetical protein